MFSEGNSLYQQDNVTYHNTQERIHLKEVFDESFTDFQIMCWPPNFSDSSSIEYLWFDLEQQVSTTTSQYTETRRITRICLVPDTSVYLSDPC